MRVRPLFRPSLPACAALAALLLGAAPARAETKFVQDVLLVGGSESQVNDLKTACQNQGWTVVDYDLNKGCGSSSDYIYLLYKSADVPGGNAALYGLVTDFYLKSGTDVPDSLTHGGRTYYLAPYVGGDHFTGRKGDLNSNAGGATIHLYYTKDAFSPERAVSSVKFSDARAGAVGENGDTTAGYDLNSGAGGADVYMHFATEAASATIDLSKIVVDGFTAADGMTLKNALPPTCALTVADNATVTLDGATVDAPSGRPGISCAGNATLVLAGSNRATGTDDAGIRVPSGKTLAISGTGSLEAAGGANSAGIGSKAGVACGGIVLSGGTVTATKGGGADCSIGPGRSGDACGTVAIGGVTTGPIAQNEITYRSAGTSYVLVFDPNGAAGQATARTYYGDTPWQIPGDLFDRPGYALTGWNAAAMGGNESFAVGQYVILRNMTIYAQWSIVTYRLSCNLSGGTLPDGASNPSSYTVETDDFTLVEPTDGHHHFIGWTGTGLSGPTRPVTIAKGSTGDRSYSANWLPNAYTVRFDANGGDGSMADQRFVYDETQNLATNAFARTGHRFAGWSTAADGAAAYADGELFSNFVVEDGAVVTLYAVWSKTPWKALQERLDAGGTVTLDGDVAALEVDASLVVTNTVTLDLNGHTLAHNGRGEAIHVGDGTFTLTNGVPASGAVTGGGDHGVYVGEGCIFLLQGGAIAGNVSDYGGGGVFVDKGMLEMTGGEISNNVCTGNALGGGGVCVYGGVFAMSGGTIADNAADADGGGVAITGGCSSESEECYAGEFAMSGGTIAGNASGNAGGGVFVSEDGFFEMSGGAIRGNSGRSGGGVYEDWSALTVSGAPVVSGNTDSAGAASDVFLANAATIAVDCLSDGARIGVATEAAPAAGAPVPFASGATADDRWRFFADDPVYEVRVDSEGDLFLAFPAWADLQALLDAGGTVVLGADYAAAAGDRSLVVTNAVTLDLNGHAVRHNGNGEVFHLGAGGDLALTNRVGGAGVVTGGGDHGVYVGDGAVFRLQGGAIADNRTYYAGGGVFVDRGTFEMSGGAITNNGSLGSIAMAGGVYVFGGPFRMTGGTIAYNTARCGGAVLVKGSGSFEMAGGEIRGNMAFDDGGGVYVSDGTIAMSGGAIRDNVAIDVGGGVFLDDGPFGMSGGVISGNRGDDGGGVHVSTNAVLAVSGAPVVSGNVNDAGGKDNVRLFGAAIAVGGLSSGASIGVTSAIEPLLVATNATAKDRARFFSDDPGRYVKYEDGSLWLVAGTPPAAFKDPEGDEITNPDVLDWIEHYGATQEDIDALGTNDRFAELFLLDLDPTKNCAAELEISSIRLDEDGCVRLDVKLTRTENGVAVGTRKINGTLKLLGRADLSTGSFTPLEPDAFDSSFEHGNAVGIEYELPASNPPAFFKAVVE